MKMPKSLKGDIVFFSNRQNEFAKCFERKSGWEKYFTKYDTSLGGYLLTAAAEATCRNKISLKNAEKILIL